MQTIKHVAAYAGVSDKTVSRVVNGEPNISLKTRTRVEDAIRALNYIPNQAARMVRTNRSGLIGLITDVVATTPNSVEIIRGVQDRVSATKQSLIIANTAGTVEAEQKIWRTFQEHRIDGVLYATMYHHEVAFAPPAQMPVVLVNCLAADRDDVPAIVPDDYQGGAAAISHLLDMGHKDIGFITLNPLILAAKLRGQAFVDVMTERGIAIHRDWVVPGYSGGIGEERICAFAAARDLLGRARPTALLAGNDEIAMQCIFAALAQGLRVPEDLAIIGFDDFEKISAQTVPPLTTVALPYYDIGWRAADRLYQILRNEDLDAPMIERLPCPLIRRAST